MLNFTEVFANPQILNKTTLMPLIFIRLFNINYCYPSTAGEGIVQGSSQEGNIVFDITYIMYCNLVSVEFSTSSRQQFLSKPPFMRYGENEEWKFSNQFLYN